MLTLTVERWPILGSFAISRGAKTEAAVVVAELSDGKVRGRGECVPYARYGETIEGVTAALEAMRPQIQQGLDRASFATRHAGRRRAQCARLRPLGSRGQARRTARLRSGRAACARTGHNRLHHFAR